MGTSLAVHKYCCRRNSSIKGLEGCANINVMLLHAGAGSVLSNSASANLPVALKFCCIFPAQSAGLIGARLLLYEPGVLNLLNLILEARFQWPLWQLKVDGEVLSPEVSCLRRAAGGTAELCSCLFAIRQAQTQTFMAQTLHLFQRARSMTAWKAFARKRGAAGRKAT